MPTVVLEVFFGKFRSNSKFQITHDFIEFFRIKAVSEIKFIFISDSFLFVIDENKKVAPRL